MLAQQSSYGFIFMRQLTTVLEAVANSLFDPRSISSVTDCPEFAFRTISPAALWLARRFAPVRVLV
jgi:cyanate permease